MITFNRTPVNELSIQAMGYLDRAIKRTPASTSRLDVTLKMAQTYGDVYVVMEDKIMMGAVYLLTYNTDEGKVISPVLVGGIKLSHWQNDLHDFLIGQAKAINAVAIKFIARKGWHKMYPMCKNIGTIYEFRM